MKLYAVDNVLTDTRNYCFEKDCKYTAKNSRNNELYKNMKIYKDNEAKQYIRTFIDREF